MAKTKTKPVYVAVVGFTLKDGTRIEPGDVFPDPPKWVIGQGKVVEAGN
jgi:hypothetical protein